MIVDLSTTALHNEDIFLSNAFANFDLCFAYAEFRKVDFGWRNAEMCADSFSELRMRRAGEDHDVANHVEE